MPQTVPKLQNPVIRTSQSGSPNKQLSSESLQEEFQASMIGEFDLPDLGDVHAKSASQALFENRLGTVMEEEGSDTAVDFEGGKVELLFNRESEGLDLEVEDDDWLHFEGFSGEFEDDDFDEDDPLGPIYDNMSKALELRDKLLVKAVLKEMEREIIPRIKTLQQTTEKYELLKKIYKLPSVSELNDKYSEDKSKDSELESVFQKLSVKAQSTPKSKQKKSKTTKYRHSKHHRRNRIRLDTIKETGEETTINTETPSVPLVEIKPTQQNKKPEETKKSALFKTVSKTNTIPIPIPSLSASYIRSHDHRDLRSLSTIELISIKNRIQNRSFPDVGRITGLVLKFEQTADHKPGQRSNPVIIRKTNNRTLLQEIEFELAVRGEVSKAVL